METKQKSLRFLILLCGILAVRSGYAQTTYIWTGAANGTNLETAGNFTTNGVDPAVTLPSGLDPSGFQESVIWDGRTTTDLNLTQGSSPGWPNTGLGTIGVNFVTTVNQTNDVLLANPPGVIVSAPIGFFGITNNSPHSSLILGTNWDTSVGNAFVLIGRPAGAVHPFVNRSTAPVIFDGSIEWEAGGGSPYTLDFSGSGDFIANSSLQTANGPGVSLQIEGPGTLIWTKVGYGVGTALLAGIGTVNVGSELIVRSAGNFSPVRLPSTITISNGASLIFDAPSQSDIIDRVITGAGMLVMSNGTFTLAGTNSYAGGTTIGGTLIIGTNGTGGSLGTGNVTNNGSLIFNRSGTLMVGGDISGVGSVTILGSGTVVLSGNNTYTGLTTVSNGTLVTAAISGTVNVNGGSLARAIDGTIGTATIGGNLNLSSGAIVATVNDSLSSSNTLYQVAGALSSTGGTLRLLNFGPDLKVGDTFKIFNKAVSGGGSMTTVSPGFTVNNNLATDGSVTVATVQSASFDKITPLLSGGQLSLSWPSAWTGLHLQVQIDAMGQGLGSNWITISGTDTSNSFTAGLMNSNVFYRLAP